jgi:hypothetical protein
MASHGGRAPRVLPPHAGPCRRPPDRAAPQFERFCRPYYTAGFNAYELVEAAMVSRRAETVDKQSGADIVDATLRDAAASGINTIRMWAHTTTSLYPFQTAPGVYDERGLKALDFVLETARKYGLQVRARARRRRRGGSAAGQRWGAVACL